LLPRQFTTNLWKGTLAQLHSKSTFSRAFADFAETKLPESVHQSLIEKTWENEIILHNSHDFTAIEAREKV
jgi:hypothetical protein